MKRREMVSLLLRKAAQDEAVLAELLPNSKFDNETVGFHAQQAAEKLLKALLADLEVDFPKIHRLDTLVDPLAIHGTNLPEEIGNLSGLTPFGTVFRYDVLPLSADIDREGLLRTVRALRGFVESRIPPERR